MTLTGHSPCPRAALLLVGCTLLAIRVPTPFAVEPPVLMRESDGKNAAPGQQGCPLSPNLTGDCGNLRYYNLCSGYIWIYSVLVENEAVGVCFVDTCISEGRSLDKAITYFRNVVPGYDNTIDLMIDVDFNGDCCPDFLLTSDLELDPGLRWNCSPLGNVCVPGGSDGIIVRTVYGGGAAPNIATDGPYNESCDPVGLPHSFYYGFNGSGCVPCIGPTGRNDNFLYWLIVDSGCTTSTEQTSWGEVKGLFR